MSPWRLSDGIERPESFSFGLTLFRRRPIDTRCLLHFRLVGVTLTMHQDGWYTTSIDSVHADSWDDSEAVPSSSSRSTANAFHAPMLTVPSSTSDIYSKDSRLPARGHHHRRTIPWRQILLAGMSLLLLASPIAAISDPGIYEPDSAAANQDSFSSSTAASKASRGSVADPVTRFLTTLLTAAPPTESNVLMPAVFRGEPVSLPTGCYRTSELIGKGSLNPWSPDLLASFLGAKRAPGGSVKSELVLCPVPRTNPMSSESYQLFSVTGFIQVSAEEGVKQSETVSSEPLFLDKEVTASSEEASWPAYGQESEGFWRQRDGKLEWEPLVPEPMPLVSPQTEGNHGDKPYTVSTEPAGASTVAAPQAGLEQSQAYDAWSASIGGESADDWLGFEEWRKRHLAEKERAEADRRSESRQKKQKAKQQSSQSGSTPLSEGETLAVTTWPNSSAGNVSDSPRTTSTTSATSASIRPTAKVHTTTISGAFESRAEVTQTHATASPAASSLTGSSVVKSATSEAKASQGQLSATSNSSPPVSSGVDDPPIAAPSPSIGDKPSPLSSMTTAPALKEPTSLLKTLKHRWNFASMDCAAVIHRTNPSAKFAPSILSEKKDRYMLSPCPRTSRGSEAVFVVVELCDEISIDTIVMANHEFFSRMFKRFKVSVAPALKGGSKGAEEWKEVGTFRARNLRGPQVFNITTPISGFYRYVRVDFLEYYGNEYYCPLSLLRVYGLTQMDHFRRQEEEDRRALEKGSFLAISDGEEIDDEEMFDEDEPTFELPADMQPSSDPGTWDAVWAEKAPLRVGYDSVWESAPTVTLTNTHSPAATSQMPAKASRSEAEMMSSIVHANNSPDIPLSSFESPVRSVVSEQSSNQHPVKVTREEADKASSSASSPIPGAVNTAMPHSCAAAPTISVAFTVHALGSTQCDRKEHSQPQSPQNRASRGDERLKPSTSHGPTAQPIASENPTTASGQPHAPRRESPGTGNGGEYGRHSGQPVGPNSPGSGGSESIYRTITKRLNSLEANATLSMQYIEHSGQMLREVFRAMEKRQETRLGDMLRALNSSNWRQVEALKRRQQVDLQRAIFEFDLHRQQTEAERKALISEVHLLATEVMFERRLGIVQLILVLSLFVFMVTTRGPAPSLIHAGVTRLASGNLQTGSRSQRAASEGREGAVPNSNHPQQLQLDNRHLQKREASGNLTTSSAEVSPVEAHGDKQTNMSTSSGHVRSGSHTPSADMQRRGSQIPAGDFAEMSPEELRSYLGFDSPRGARSQTPAEFDLSFHDETGDEGLETAIEEMDSNTDAHSEFGDPDDELDGTDGANTLHLRQGTQAFSSALDKKFRRHRSLTPTPITVGTDAEAAEGKEQSAQTPEKPRENSPSSKVPASVHITPIKAPRSQLAASGVVSPPRVTTPLRPRSATSMGQPRKLTPDSDASDGDDDGAGSNASVVRGHHEESDGGPWQKVTSRRLHTPTSSSRPRPKSMLSPLSRDSFSSPASASQSPFSTFAARERDHRWSVAPRAQTIFLPDDHDDTPSVSPTTATHYNSSTPPPSARGHNVRYSATHGIRRHSPPPSQSSNATQSSNRRRSTLKPNKINAEDLMGSPTSSQQPRSPPPSSGHLAADRLDTLRQENGRHRTEDGQYGSALQRSFSDGVRHIGRSFVHDRSHKIAKAGP